MYKKKPEKPADQQLAEILADFYADPLGHVMFSYPWNTYKPIQIVKLPEPWRSEFDCEFGPDGWACEFLEEIGEQIAERAFNGVEAVDPVQHAIASGHGIGKSADVAWLIKFIMDTRPFAKGVVTAGKFDQLRTKTWAELGKWHKISQTAHWFHYSTGRGSMSLIHKDHPETWRCDAQTCKEENSDSFAGLHAANSSPFYIFDEASAVPNKIYEVREGGLTDGEPFVFDFGNPTTNSGRFFEECEGRFRRHFTVRHIDSRDVAITNKRLFKRWEETYGEDSDFFRVRVRGQFPRASSAQFIGTDLVEAAMKRAVARDDSAPLVIGVDVARFGDDESVIYPRIGYDARSFPPVRTRGLDTVQLAGRVVEMKREFEKLGKNVDGLFVDGGGVGGGVVDVLRNSGHDVIEVQFGGKPDNPREYRFKTDEIWGKMKEGLSRLCLPNLKTDDGEDLRDQLTQREYGYTVKDQLIQLETKKDMKERGVASPDLADALALTFARDIVKSDLNLDKLSGGSNEAVHDYDPLDDAA